MASMSAMPGIESGACFWDNTHSTQVPSTLFNTGDHKMEILFAVIGLVVGGVLAGIVAWVLASSRVGKIQGTLEELRQHAEALQAKVVSLDAELTAERQARTEAETKLTEATRNLAEQKKLLEDAQSQLTNTFKALSADALKSNNQAFLELAKKTLDAVVTDAKGDLGKKQEAIQGLVKPLKDALVRYETHVKALEESRQKAYGGLEEHLKTLVSTQQSLRKETGNLVTALRAPQVRGRWGEMTLKRAVELAGMSEHCDFTEQVTVESEAGKLRPDMIVRLPAGQEIVLDAKVALDAYLDAVSAESDDDRKVCLTRHARQVRDHMNKLSQKSYWKQFKKAPEFVVMFIPGESFFAAAVDIDKTLIEDGINNKIVIVTPATLIALLRAVAYGWRQEQLAEHAEFVCDLGKQLYERIKTFAQHMGSVGKGLEKANDSYNKAVGSLESRVFPAARKFEELGVTPGPDIPAIQPVETLPRSLTANDTEGD